MVDVPQATQAPRTEHRAGAFTRLLWVLTFLGGLLGGLVLIGSAVASSGAPQQAAGAAIAIGLAVIPYCLARASNELGKP